MNPEREEQYQQKQQQRQQQQQQRISELRSRRWGHAKGFSTESDYELSLRSSSLTTSISTTETICETSTTQFEFCRPNSNNQQQKTASGSTSPVPFLGSPSHSPHSPRSPRSPRSPLHSPGFHTPASGSPSQRYSSAQRKRASALPGNLARLASRRSSRDSEAGEPSPLQCSRNQQRRTSNFLEIPGDFVFFITIKKKFEIYLNIRRL